MPETNIPPHPVWTVCSRPVPFGRLPLLMGIVNVTPDSFSDGGQFAALDAAVRRGIDLAEEGADLLDIGGESTRPGATPVDLDEELRRVIPVVTALARTVSIPISIDTTKSEVARQAIAAGATIVNDVSGLEWDPAMPRVCAETGAGVICMHTRGTPETMHGLTDYVDVVAEVRAYLERRVDALIAAGIADEAIVVDPGIGFAKDAAQNFVLLSHVQALRARGRPILIGHSRKRFLGKLLGREVDERSSGTIGISIALAEQGADILRVHDVRAVRDALVAWDAVRSPA